MRNEYISRSPDETERIGERLADMLSMAPAVALRGGLGAGKTALTRGIVRGMGSADMVSSPTYSLVNEYRAPRKICHFDLYRLQNEDELYDIGWYDYLATGALCIVEWSERAMRAMPPGTVAVDIEITGEDERAITVTTC